MSPAASGGAGGRGRVGVLASGSGTILEAMLGAGVPVAVVVVDRRCRAEAVAENAGVASVLVERTDFGPSFEREAFTGRVVAALRAAQVELVAMAGFGTILGTEIFAAFPGAVLNTHPSLLPAFPGWHAVRDALAAGVAVTGCTVHLAGEEVDAGPILAQEEVAVLPGDDEESLHERIKTAERRLYPETVLRVLADRSAGAGDAAGARHLPPNEPRAGAPTVTAIDHVQLAMPPGREDEADVFYRDVLGLRPLAKPEPLASRGGRWFAAGAAQLHLGVEQDFRPARKAHPALRVAHFDDLLGRLDAGGRAWRRDMDLPGVRRVYVDDPFGNRVELIEDPD